MNFTQEEIDKIPRKLESKYHITLSNDNMISWLKNKIGDQGSIELKLHIPNNQYGDGYIWIVYSGGPTYDDIQMSDFDDINNYMKAVDAQIPNGMKYNIYYKGHGPRSNQFPEYKHIFGSAITEEQLQEMLNRSTIKELMNEDCEEGCGCEDFEDESIQKIETIQLDKVGWKYILEHLTLKIDYRETDHEYRTQPYNITHIDGDKLDVELSLESLYLLSDIQKILNDSENEEDKLDGYDRYYKYAARKLIRVFLDS